MEILNFIFPVPFYTIELGMEVIDMFAENESFQLILHSGNARSLANESMKSVKSGDFDVAKEKLIEAKKELIFAQKQHAEMLRKMACEDNVLVNLLMVHAEDHVSGSQNTLELANEVLEIYERFGMEK